jgi:hypothetical protein
VRASLRPHSSPAARLNHFEIIEAMASKYALLGAISPAQMGLG